MKDLHLSEALRYMFPSVVAYAYLYLSDAHQAQNLITSLDILGTILLVVSGSVIYLAYRPLIYQRIILPMQDFCRRKSDNYRTFIKKRYKKCYKIGTYEASLLWVQIRDKYFRQCYSEMMQSSASGIHLLYLASILAIPFAIWRIVVNDFKVMGILFGIFLICFSAAFLSDRYYEDTEVRFMYLLDKKELDSFASKLLCKS